MKLAFSAWLGLPFSEAGGSSVLPGTHWHVPHNRWGTLQVLGLCHTALECALGSQAHVGEKTVSATNLAELQ